ncbi:MAG: hypothetical protein U1E78_08380 [Gammaproteobacteria bacterium]
MKYLEASELTQINGGQQGIFWPSVNGFVYFAILGVIVSYYTSNPNWIGALGLTGAAIFCVISQGDASTIIEKSRILQSSD